MLLPNMQTEPPMAFAACNRKPTAPEEPMQPQCGSRHICMFIPSHWTASKPNTITQPLHSHKVCWTPVESVCHAFILYQHTTSPTVAPSDTCMCAQKTAAMACSKGVRHSRAQPNSRTAPITRMYSAPQSLEKEGGGGYCCQHAAAVGSSNHVEQPQHACDMLAQGPSLVARGLMEPGMRLGTVLSK